MSVYLDIKSLNPLLKVNWNVLMCKLCIAWRLVVNIFPWCNANFVPFPSRTLVARRMQNGRIDTTFPRCCWVIRSRIVQIKEVLPQFISVYVFFVLRMWFNIFLISDPKIIFLILRLKKILSIDATLDLQNYVLNFGKLSFVSMKIKCYLTLGGTGTFCKALWEDLDWLKSILHPVTSPRKRNGLCI